MKWITRRDFMKRTAGSVATGLALASFGISAQGTQKFAATGKRTLGKTGIECSLLGMGTGTRAGNGSSEQNRQGRKAFVSLLEHAYASGVTYFDMADSYGAHDYMKDALRNSIKREDVMFLTKTMSREPSLVRADLERFRRELDTPYLDICLMHCLTDADWAPKLQGCMDELSEAKAQGQIRAHGVSCHTLEALKLAADTEWVDVILARINPFGAKMDGKPEEVVPVLQKAKANGKVVLGMKIAGEGEMVDRIPESLHFVLGLGCVDAMTIGALKPAEIDANIGHIAAVTV